MHAASPSAGEQQHATPAAQDVLSDVLRSLSVPYCRIGMLEFGNNSALHMYDTAHKPFAVCMCLVSGAPLWVTPRNEAPFQLHPGTTLFTTTEARAVYRTALDAPVSELAALRQLQARQPDFSTPRNLFIGNRQGPVHASMLAISFGMDNREQRYLLKNLPQIALIDHNDVSIAALIAYAQEFLRIEGANKQEGYAAISRAFGELMLISLLRTMLLHTTSLSSGLIKGLHDSRIARAIAAIHHHPANPWTVAELASAAGMSRTAFANRFAELLDKSPIEYLTEWRMHLACQRLKQGKCNIARLAQELGYASEGTFRQAFKRQLGVPPSQFTEG